MTIKFQQLSMNLNRARIICCTTAVILGEMLTKIKVKLWAHLLNSNAVHCSVIYLVHMDAHISIYFMVKQSVIFV